jgi:hypothetical protein
VSSALRTGAAILTPFRDRVKFPERIRIEPGSTQGILEGSSAALILNLRLRVTASKALADVALSKPGKLSLDMSERDCEGGEFTQANADRVWRD